MNKLNNKNKIRVLIVDDSAVMRKVIQELLSRDPEIEVVSTATDPFIARDKLVTFQPDVMTLDIEMPRMNGITFLERVMEHFPTRTLVLSNVLQYDSLIAQRALFNGAVDVMAKPTLESDGLFDKFGKELIAKVKMVARAKLPKAKNNPTLLTSAILQEKYTVQTTKELKLLVFGSSTGGTEALKVILPQLSTEDYAILIVQHISPSFTKGFAKTLNSLCSFEVREAKHGEEIRPGLALLAPGDFHMEISHKINKYFIKLHQANPLHGVRPAVDYLMHSVAEHMGSNAIGIILTGMGKDGATGLLAMRQAGAMTLAQDEKSSVVFGMPKSAIEIGAVQKIVPLNQIGRLILSQLK